MATQTEVVFVLHWRERSKPSNTTRLAHTLLPNSRILERGRSRQTACVVDSALRQLPPEDCLLLYPSEDAAPLTNADTCKHLIVPDGTWGQTRRWLRRESCLQSLRRVCLSHEAPLPAYLLRRAPGPGLSSTFAATAFALACLESPLVATRLLEHFDEWQRRALRSRDGGLGVTLR